MSTSPGITAIDAQLVLHHLRALHPERAEQLSGVVDFIRRMDNHNTALRTDLLKTQGIADEYKILFHGSLCQRIKRFFTGVKVNPNVG
jgi:hypothetical protein